MKKLPSYMEKRAAVHRYYMENLKDIEWLTLPDPLPEYCKSSYYFYHVQVTNGKRDEYARFLRENDIYTTYRYFPLHRVPKYGIADQFPNADYATDHTLCLPMHQSLSQEDLAFIVEKTKEFGRRYC